MRIAEFVNSLEVGGTEKMVVDLALDLRSRGHELTVICLRSAGVLADALIEQGVEVVQLDKPEGPSLSVLKQLVSVLKRRSIQVVHSHNPLVHHYAVLGGRLAGVRVVVNTIHGTSNLSPDIGFKERLYGLMCRFGDRVVAVCPSAYSAFREIETIPKDKLICVNNGISLGRFLSIEPKPHDAGVTFGIVARLVPVKDHATLLRAFKLAQEQVDDVQLEILGDGPLREELEALTNRLELAGRVTFHGFSADVPGFMRAIDVSVLCSQSEGLPLGVLESMAAGLPVVGTDVGGMRDLVEGAQCGWLCPPKDVELLARSIIAAAATHREERYTMGTRAREFVVANYSLERMGLEYEQLFLKIMSSA